VVCTQSPHTQGEEHEQKNTVAGRSCHCRADRRWRFEQSCRNPQHRVEEGVVGAGDAVEGILGVEEGVLVGAGDAVEGILGLEEGVLVGARDAVEGVLAVKGCRSRWSTQPLTHMEQT
jgi:hypothetical protein